MIEQAAQRRLAGWGHRPVVDAPVVFPTSIDQVGAAVRSAPRVVPRALGRSYGDASLTAPDGLALDLRYLDRWQAFDADAGVIDVEAGVSLQDILATVVPRGWFLPVSPGTQRVSVGGAIASDIHGKNHHVDGSFSGFVERLVLIGADGEPRPCGPDDQPELFWASVGGQGLLGPIVQARLRLRRIDSAWIRQRAIRCGRLGDLLDAMEQESAATYSVAWIDISRSKRRLGRGVLLLGEHAAAQELPAGVERRRWEVDRRRRLGVPWRPPVNLLNSSFVSWFNLVYYGLNRSGEAWSHYGRFFHPLDGVGHWNRLYGGQGFLQYQLVLPQAAGRGALERVFEELARFGRSSFLTVLKKMGPAGPAPLGFPLQGWTLALDFPYHPRLEPMLERLDRIVTDVGGRIYLTKDARLSPQAFREMYPRYGEWLETKRAFDPRAKFRSHLSHRLGIDRDVVERQTDPNPGGTEPTVGSARIKAGRQTGADDEAPRS